MKKMIMPLVLITVLLSACKDNVVNHVIWKVNGTSYSTTGFSPTGNNTQLMAEDGGSSLQLFFKNIPTAEGNYTFTVVDESKAAHGTLGDNEAAVEINVGANDVYLSTGIPANTQFTLDVERGGIHQFTIPDIKALHQAGSGTIDTATISTTFYQTGSN